MNEEFEETRKLPTEEKMIEEYGVSRNTIRNAIKILMILLPGLSIVTPRVELRYTVPFFFGARTNIPLP